MFTILTLAGVVALSGCSANKSESGAEPTKAAKSDTTAAPVNLNWISTVGFWNPPQWSTESGTVMGEITKKTGVTFSYNIPAQDGETKLSLMMVSSSEAFPDVITTAGENMGRKLVQADKVWKLDEFLKKYDPESHLLKDFPADTKKAVAKRYGDWYALPSHVGSEDAKKTYPASSSYYEEQGKYAWNKGILINSDILKQAGLTIDDMKTEDGFLAALKKVKDMKLTVDGQPVIPLQLHGKNYHGESLQFLQASFGAMGIDKDGKSRNSYLSPETKHSIQFLFKAAQGGYFDPGQLTTDGAAVTANLLSKRVFAFIGNNSAGEFAKLNFWVSPGAILSNQGTKPVFAFWSEASAGWMQTFISKSTKEPERLAKWLSFMTSPEGMTLNHYGIEGVHFTKNDKGLLVRTEKGLQDQKDSIKTGLDIFWQFANLSFLDSVTPAPTKREGAGGLIQAEATTAFGKAKEIVRWDSSVLALPGTFYAAGSKNVMIRDQVQQFFEAQLAKMVLAKDEAAFNKLYDEYIAKLKELKIDELDAAIDVELQKNMKEKGITVKGVNS